MKNVQWRCTRSTNFPMFYTITFEAHRASVIGIRQQCCCHRCRSLQLMLIVRLLLTFSFLFFSEKCLYFFLVWCVFFFVFFRRLTIYFSRALIFPIGWSDAANVADSLDAAPTAECARRCVFLDISSLER